MRLRRVELVIIGVTLAFVCFMGGFFTGRSLSAVNVVSVDAGSTAHGMHVGVQFELGDTNDTQGQIAASANLGETEQETSFKPPQTGTQSNPQTEPAAGTPRSGDGRININTASQTELTDLPGVGNTISARIVEYRQQHGEFNNIDDIMNVSGIGERRFEAIKDLITVGG
ncbi:MAG: ComEA family DNA-binding protein [Oscillospiraceae bacterium]|nr:ComEA family DNA-binding protein [Oscillospiraceae bacterium]MCL2278028.1 ComEA family DNA-binding protein [Oscillospiraceae bacterium]